MTKADKETEQWLAEVRQAVCVNHCEHDPKFVGATGHCLYFDSDSICGHRCELVRPDAEKEAHE